MAFKEITLLLTICVFGAEAELSWNNCDRSAPIQLKALSLRSSYPIQIKPNAKISASGRYFNSYSATSESKFKLSLFLEKKVGKGWFSFFVKIPCIKGVGSCTYDVTCSQIPGCPGLPGEQPFDETITIPGNFNPDSFARFAGSGTYRGTVDVREIGSNRRVACGQGKVEIVL